jgi:hypothetical protein
MPEALASSGRMRVEHEKHLVSRMGSEGWDRVHPSAREQSGSQKARRIVRQSMKGLWC